jgi:hypothetical protein
MNDKSLRHRKPLISAIKSTVLLYSLLSLLLAFQSCSKEETVEEKKAQIQMRLDAGETPIEILNNSNGYFYHFLYGLTYHGGIIIYYDDSKGAGLIVSHQELDASPWGCHNIHVTNLPSVRVGAGSYGPSNSEGRLLGDGLKNTLKIIALECGIFSAAQICVDYENEGNSDWFLPSMGELQIIKRAAEDRLINLHGEYWSSTAYGINNVQDTTSAWPLFINRADKCILYPGELLSPDTYTCSFIDERDQIKKVRAISYF